MTWVPWIGGEVRSHRSRSNRGWWWYVAPPGLLAMRIRRGLLWCPLDGAILVLLLAGQVCGGLIVFPRDIDISRKGNGKGVHEEASGEAIFIVHAELG
jgi:hypothetical protein